MRRELGCGDRCSCGSLTFEGSGEVSMQLRTNGWRVHSYTT
jgi:hypothetical protein